MLWERVESLPSLCPTGPTEESWQKAGAWHGVWHSLGAQEKSLERRA